jgi:hypothetical protein
VPELQQRIGLRYELDVIDVAVRGQQPWLRLRGDGDALAGLSAETLVLISHLLTTNRNLTIPGGMSGGRLCSRSGR